MKRFSGTFMAVAFALGLAGCGDDDDDIGGFADSAPPPDVSLLPDAAVPPPDAAEGAPDAEPLADAPLPLPDAPMSEEGPDITIVRLKQGPQSSTCPLPGDTALWTNDDYSTKCIDPAENTSDLGYYRVVTGPDFRVECEVAPDPTTGLLVDPASVSISVIDRLGASSTQPGVPTGSPDIYVADFTTPSFKSGTLTVRCQGADLGFPPNVNSAEVSNFIDLGPQLIMAQPASGSAHANSVAVLAQAVPSELIPGSDPGAQVEDVKLCAATASIPLLGLGGGLFQTTLYFDAEDFQGDSLFTTTDPTELGSLTVDPPYQIVASPEERLTPFYNCAETARPVNPANPALPWDPAIDGATSMRFFARNRRLTMASPTPPTPPAGVVGLPPVERRLERSYIADSQGPTIVITAPATGQMVGGVMSVSAEVSDPAGVADVTATLSHDPDFEITLSAGSGATYTGTFDTRAVPRHFVFPVLEVRAVDSVGNKSASGRPITLDNTGPYLTLDSPNVREGEAISDPTCLQKPVCTGAEPEGTLCQDPLCASVCGARSDCQNSWYGTECLADPTSSGCAAAVDSDDGDTCRSACLVDFGCDTCFRCTRLFDPLADDAINDGDTGVGNFINFRVRAEDLGNRPLFEPTTTKLPVATMETSSVQLMLYDADQLGAKPLLVDTDPTDADVYCNAVNPDLVPSTLPVGPEEILVVDLAPIAPRGGRQPCVDSSCAYGTDYDILDDAACIDYPSIFPVFPVCGSTTLERVIASEDGSVAAIYGVPPLGCIGNEFDVSGNNLDEGWHCAIATGFDKLGNFGVSPPLEFCVDLNPFDGTDHCAVSAPSCTDGCDEPLTFGTPGQSPSHGHFQLVERVPECSDGIDNDEDGATDFPEDIGCSSADDPSES